MICFIHRVTIMYICHGQFQGIDPDEHRKLSTQLADLRSTLATRESELQASETKLANIRS